jgi:signal transduction histidine kinase
MRGSPFQSLRDWPINRKLSLILGLIAVLLTGALIGLAVGMNTLSSLRGFVGGESLWSKAQKDALYSLQKYVHYQDEKDYQAFLKYLSVQHGDQKARLALSKPRPDVDQATEGFLEGGNHPDDIPGMIRLFTRYHNLPPIRRAIHAWVAADEEVGKLIIQADTLHQLIASGRTSRSDLQPMLQKIEQANLVLTDLENKFSAELGEASRWTRKVLLTGILLLTVALGALALIITFIVSQNISSGIHAIRKATQKIAQGELGGRVEWPAQDEIGQLARAVDQMSLNLKKAEEVKSEFLSNVSHELRTPLTLTLAPVESLIAGDYGPLSKPQQQTLKTIHNNAVRLLQMVNGLLDFSKLEAQKVEVKREPIDLAAETRAVLQDFQPLLESKGLSSQTDIPVSARVMMDRYIYERILFNLLSNAIKFTPAGGTITVQLKVTSPRFELRVQDTGIGIPAIEIPQLFQRFRQLEGSATRRFEGTGLGLALVKEFASLLDGTVSVESEQGKGSTFRVEGEAPDSLGVAAPVQKLPPLVLQRYTAETDKNVPVETAAPETLVDVLIAEDNPEMARYISELLQPYCRPTLTRDGEEALFLLRTRPYAMVLSDVMMPKMDGMTLCRTIKQDPALAKTKVLLLTALTHREALMQGWQAGADEYLFKPFHPKELVTRVRSLLSSIHDQTKTEQALRMKETELQQASKLEAIGRLAGGVAHDFNNLLAGMTGLGEELKESLRLEPVKYEILEEMLKACARATALTRQLLMFARKDNIQPRTLDLNAVILETVPFLQRLVGENIVIETAVRPAFPIRIDPNQLQQILLNLSVNARDAMPQGGLLRITTSSAEMEQPEKERRQIQRTLGPHTVLEISDTGSGIREDVLPHLFEPFFTTKDKSSGTGLGLASVYGILQQNGGDISVQSHVGKGTLFKIYFPKAPEGPAPLATEETAKEGGHETILVVEDDPIVRRAVVKKLEKHGYHVLQAQDGPEALKFKEPIDLLLTDVVMPGMNGKQLADQWTARQPGLPVLFMSGYPEDTVAKQGIIPSKIVFLDKSRISSTLLSKIRETLQKTLTHPPLA